MASTPVASTGWTSRIAPGLVLDGFWSVPASWSGYLDPI